MRHPIRSFPLPIPAAAATLAMLAIGTALAAPGADNPGWQVTAGGGVVSRPLYAGSAQRKTSGFPLISAEYGRYFIGSLPGAGVPAGAGAYLAQGERWKLGVGLTGDFGKARKESDSPRLKGMGDISATAFGAVFATYEHGWFSAHGSVLTDIGGKDQGTRVSFGFEGKLVIGESLVLSAGPSVTWADSHYTQTHFGIDAVQSANSGRAEYRAGGGVQSAGLGVSARYQLTPEWMAGAMLSANRLRGDAAASPLVERKTQTTYGLFAAYRF